MRNALLTSLALGSVLLISTSANATLVGSTVSGSFSDFFETLTFKPAVVGPGVEASATDIFDDTVSIDAYANGFELLFSRPSPAGNFTFGPSKLSLTFSTPVVGAVSYVGSDNLDSGNPSNISSTSTTININFGFLALNGNGDQDHAYIKYAVAAPTATVPEPASWAMFIGGFGVIGAAMRRRRTSLNFA